MPPLPPQQDHGTEHETSSHHCGTMNDSKWSDSEAEEGHSETAVVESSLGGVATKRFRRRRNGWGGSNNSESAVGLSLRAPKSAGKSMARGRTVYRSPLTWEYWVQLPTGLLLQIVAGLLLLLGLLSLALYQIRLLQQMERGHAGGGGRLSKNPHRTDRMPPMKRHAGKKGILSKLGHLFSGESESDGYGDFSQRYLNLRKEFDDRLPFEASNPEDVERVKTFVQDHVRQRTYQVVDDEVASDKEDYYDAHNCPFTPPPGYPRDYPILDVLQHWPPDDVEPRSHIYQGLCRFDYNTERDKALNYRRLEVPFVVRDDPAVLETVQRWNTQDYVQRLLGRVPHRTEYSTNNHFMYWLLPPNQYKKEKQKQKQARRDAKRAAWDEAAIVQKSPRQGRRLLAQDERAPFADPDHYDSKHWHDVEDPPRAARQQQQDDDAAAGDDHRPPFRSNGTPRTRRSKIEPPPGWSAPTELSRLRYDEWLEHANVTSVGSEDPHWYYRLIGCGAMGKCDRDSSEYLFQELPFFYPQDNQLYIVEPDRQKGIHCRFGMQGIIAENHFDGSRNAIVVLGGERRYLLSHPRHCENMVLFPKGHPSARHSAVDWSAPDLDKFPEFAQVRTNEVVLQAGDVLYLPTNWFHYIVSLGLNWQCNTRSGINNDYMDPIHECGF